MCMKRGSDESGGGAPWFKALQHASLGIQMALAVVVGYFIGHWLDGVLDTAPYMMILWVVIGVVTGMRELYRAAQRAARDMDDSDEDSG